MRQRDDMVSRPRGKNEEGRAGVSRQCQCSPTRRRLSPSNKRVLHSDSIEASIVVVCVILLLSAVLLLFGGFARADDIIDEQSIEDLKKKFDALNGIYECIDGEVVVCAAEKDKVTLPVPTVCSTVCQQSVCPVVPNTVVCQSDNNFLDLTRSCRSLKHCSRVTCGQSGCQEMAFLNISGLIRCATDESCIGASVSGSNAVCRGLRSCEGATIEDGSEVQCQDDTCSNAVITGSRVICERGACRNADFDAAEVDCSQGACDGASFDLCSCCEGVGCQANSARSCDDDRDAICADVVLGKTCEELGQPICRDISDTQQSTPMPSSRSTPQPTPPPSMKPNEEPAPQTTAADSVKTWAPIAGGVVLVIIAVVMCCPDAVIKYNECFKILGFIEKPEPTSSEALSEPSTGDDKQRPETSTDHDVKNVAAPHTPPQSRSDKNSDKSQTTRTHAPTVSDGSS